MLAPLLAPLGVAYGIEPIHLGVVFLANLELGFLFPPMGLNLFLAASRFGKPLPYVYKRTFPFLLIMSVGVLAITYLPDPHDRRGEALHEVARDLAGHPSLSAKSVKVTAYAPATSIA